MSRQVRTITHVEIENYKSIAHLPLELEPLTVLVGQNATGKSNFVDALRFLPEALVTGLEGAVQKRDGLESLRRQPARADSTVRIGLTVATDALQAVYDVGVGQTEGMVGGQYSVMHERAELRSGGDRQTIYRHGPRLEITHFRPDGSPGEPMSVMTPVSDRALALPTLGGAGVESLKEALVMVCSYSITPSALRGQQEAAAASPLEGRGGNLASALEVMGTDHADSLGQVRDGMARMVAGVSDVRVERVGGGRRVVQLQHVDDGGAPQWFELARESDGTIRLLALMVALCQQPPPTLVAIEEPELYVHAGAMAVLCDEIRAASHRTQVIITTHSTDLMDRFTPDEIRVVEKHDGKTEIGEMAESQREAVQKKLFAPGELVQVDGSLRIRRGES